MKHEIIIWVYSLRKMIIMRFLAYYIWSKLYKVNRNVFLGGKYISSFSTLFGLPVYFSYPIEKGIYPERKDISFIVNINKIFLKELTLENASILHNGTFFFMRLSRAVGNLGSEFIDKALSKHLATV